MRLMGYILALVVSTTFAYAPAAYADDSISTMAKIVIGLKHFPSDADKAALAAIANGDGSADEKAVAQAIANIAHKVTDADKAKLQSVIDGDSASSQLRTLAQVVAGINHVPSADAVASLQGLAN